MHDNLFLDALVWDDEMEVISASESRTVNGKPEGVGITAWTTWSVPCTFFRVCAEPVESYSQLHNSEKPECHFIRDFVWQTADKDIRSQ